MAHPRGCPRGLCERKGQATDATACPPTSSAISSILGTWLDQYSEDFCQPPDFPCLKQLVAYVQLNMPGSDLERRAHLLLAQLERAEPAQAEPEGEKAGAGCLGLCGDGSVLGPTGTSPTGWCGARSKAGLRAPSGCTALGEPSR